MDNIPIIFLIGNRLPFNVANDGFISSYLASFAKNEATAPLVTLCLEKAPRKGPEGLRPVTALPADAPGWLPRRLTVGGEMTMPDGQSVSGWSIGRRGVLWRLSQARFKEFVNRDK